MKSAIYKDNVLPNAMIRDILVGNPQSAKTPDVIQTLDNRFDPMPDYMMAEIMQGQSVYGAKEILEQKLAKHKTIRGKSLSKLISHYKSDTLNISASIDSLISLLQNENYPSPHYQLGMLYMDQNDSANAFVTLNNIPVEFDLTNDEQNTHDLYSDLFDVLWQITSDTAALDSLRIQALLDISDNYWKLPGVYAMNMLINEGVLIYNEPVYLPDILKSMPAWQTNTETTKHDGILHIFPNPAGNYFIAEYDLSKETGMSMLILCDITGKTFQMIHLKDKQNQRVISTEGYPNGVYILQLFVDGNLKESVKLSVSR